MKILGRGARKVKLLLILMSNSQIQNRLLGLSYYWAPSSRVHERKLPKTKKCA